MRFRPTRVAQASVLCLACWTGLQATAFAQAAPNAATVVPGERLSDWLLRNAGPLADTTSLQWQVPSERAPQAQLRQAAVLGVQMSTGDDFSAEARVHLSDWLMALQLTGRLTVAIADARWLQGAPAHDPILQDGQRIVLLPRPSTVTVVNEAGLPCTASHTPGALIQDYLRACLGDSSSTQVDWAWIAQADGRTARYGVAPWSQEAQAEPGPGAWIWAPSRQMGISDNTSDNLARFLATQAPGEFMLPATQIRTVAVQRASIERPEALKLTASDWGEIGLLQTPTARMAASGDVRLHVSKVAPYTSGTVMFQRFEWLESGFRYTNVANRLYGPDIAGDQSYKDKSIDLKLRLREESALGPQIALGMRDLGGTGLFSSEYLVANKRWGNWDASLGLGWGYLAGRGNMKNPLSVLGNDFDKRAAPTVGQGGVVNGQSMFHGPTALFGGVQWQSPSTPWIAKLELDGNDYQHEPQGNNHTAKSPFNFGAVYRYSPNIDLSLGLERGNTFMLGFTLHGGLNALYSPKLLDPALPSVRPLAPGKLPSGGWDSTAQAIERHTGWSVRGIAHQHTSTTMVAETDTAVHLQERIDRAVTILHRDTPASSTRFVLQLQERGLPMLQVDIDRAEWVTLQTRAEPPSLRLPAQRVSPGQATTILTAGPDEEADRAWTGKPVGFTGEWSPSYSQILGGPNNFLLYQLGLQAMLEQRFSDNTWLSSTVNLRLLDNYGGFVYDAPSELPRVRTHQREYVTTSALTMPLMQLTHVQDLGNGHYVSGYAGMLETMYGGVGAEWLYRPWQSRLAWGIDVNHVRQRNFSQNFAFRDYEVDSGHATMYWDTGWKNLQVNLSAGRYLAGDMGATLDVKRTFSNGVAAGAWATKTDISAETFGEGSFDKGIYVTIPFDVMLPKSTSTNGSIVWTPLTRDGGARLGRRFALNDLTRQRDYRTLGWRSAGPSSVRSAENTSYVLPESTPNPFIKLGDTTSTLRHQIADVPASTWLLAGGAILASSLLDKPIDNWAQNHQGGSAERLGNATNTLPIAMALGAGLLYTGIGGESASSTAETALTAAATTWGANLVTRFVVGRARPFEEEGSGSFNGFANNSAQSGFASNHVAVAFALATPFAQQHDMPWLYAVAATSAFGRVQQREHWASDTVAGAFMGYAIGSMLTDQQLHRKSGIRLNVTPQAVVANWSFK